MGPMKTNISNIAPVAPKKPFKISKHGDTRIDDYFWLREKENPLTMKYLKEENAYFEQHMKPLGKLKDRLFKEMKSRIKEDDASVPAPYGEWLYYRRFKKGKQYAIELRKPKNGNGKEQTLLDGNIVAKGKKYSHVTNDSVSPNQNIYAYAADFDGSERYTIYFKDLTTGKMLKDQLKNSNGSYAFANDNSTIFYTVLDENLRPYRVFKHILGTDPKKDILVFEEKDSKHFVGIGKSASSNFIFIGSHGKVTSEIWYIDAHNPSIPAKCFQPRIEGVEYDVDHNGDNFWITTNHKALNFKVARCALTDTSIKKWTDFIKHNPKVMIDSVHFFKRYMVISQRENGLQQIRIYDLQTNRSHIIKFADAAYTVSVHPDNYEYETHVLRISYASPIVPASVIDYDMNTRKSKTLKTVFVKGHNPKKYICERVWVKGHDGVKIPLVLTYKKGIKKNFKNPTYLYGYGSYGATIPDSFPSYRDMYRLIDRGFVYALAHIRGGGEMGRKWYEDGKFLKKMNTFKDFISCADFLKKAGYSAPDKLAIAGGSAGGMLMGACMNMRPDLFDVVVAHVPFVDVVNTMLDKDLPLTQMEYKEWGNPDDKKYYRYMKSYSPYDNVKKTDYPHMFVTCGLNDPRVTYWEPAKWVAKLREYKTDNNTLIFKTNMGAGHFGASGRFDHLGENAEEYAFILSKFGLA